ncbi:MAG: DUF262 domain-containing protein [Verrucomicrobiota bacterium]|jgi:hypothetical protein
MNEEPSTFRSIFFRSDNAVPVRVPDYQRAYSWEQKQIELFLADLVKYQGGDKGRYYFGHFIAMDTEEPWDIVDGQQRITTFVLFLMVCRVRSPSGAHASAYSMIERFSTVSYDVKALETICRNLGPFLEANGHFDDRNPPSDKQISAGLSLPEQNFTRSQRRMVLALLRFHQAFQKGELRRDHITGYIEMILKAHCSRHLIKDNSVAVNIFEMQNTRGIPLTTLEIIKAMLMKFVYDHGGGNRELKVGQIQAEFGEIYRMEEQLAAQSFRGEMTMEHLLRLHLRVVDDGTKQYAKDFHSPTTDANPGKLVEYVDLKLHYKDGDKTKTEKDREDGVQYALNLAKEFKKSVRIVSETLPAWDGERDCALVGDALILDLDLSCQFFLIICRCLQSGKDKADGRIGKDSLRLWEKLLFIRDFHGEYYNLKGSRDDFPTLFASCGVDEERITEEIKKYLANGFRPARTKELQSIVVKYLNDNKETILNKAFHWHPWKYKMSYAIYKYEINEGANIRDVMKGRISVEHILPQGWYDIDEKLKRMKSNSPIEWDALRKDIDDHINGIGNLLLITGAENTSVSNNHPADKKYVCTGGSYDDHNQNREKWRSSEKWLEHISVRGEKIFNFMLRNLVDDSENSRSSLPH